MGILTDLLSALLPFCCHVCSESTRFGEVLCSRCNEQLFQALKEPVSVNDTICDFPVYTLSEYDSFVSEIVRLIKYRPSRKLTGYIEKIIVGRKLLQKDFSRHHIFIPVPMHPSREAQRGFNQAQIFAEIFAGSLGSNFSPALRRVVATVPQAGCNEEQRLENLKGAIELEAGLLKSCFKNKNLVLVDDVATTGTTLQQCREQLQSLEPASITALVVSHSYRKVPPAIKI
ncbi:MAG: ComF family protein [Candidatus Rifleibacteriota bacterium]